MLHMVAACVGAPRDPEVKMELKELITRINENTAEQEDSTADFRRRSRGEDGRWGFPLLEIKKRETTPLELLLQKWKPTALPSPAPESEEVVEPLPSPEPRAAIKGGQPVNATPVLLGVVLYPDNMGTRLECPDLPLLDLVPRSQFLVPLLLETQSSLRKRQKTLAFLLLVSAFPLPAALLPLVVVPSHEHRRKGDPPSSLPVQEGED
ncbi:UNVERIFIED_CONTAM: hypothetical protein FKN15_065656 [Acipenser sinensis]